MKSQIPWHTIGETETLKQIGSSLEGLTNSEAKKRQRIHGLNEPVHQKPRSIWWTLLEQFQSPLVYLLIVSAIITYVLDHMIDTWVILAIVIINAAVGFLQELKAEKSLEALKKIVSLRSIVIREHEEEEIPAIELVPGDIVVLDSGVKVPADLRLLKCDDLKIDESALTGESIPVHKNIKSLSEKTVVADRKNMAYASTIVTNGRGLGVIIATGERTQIGKIAKEVAQTIEEKTPLHKNLEQFSRYLLYAVGIVCGFIFILGIIKGLGILNMFLTAVAAAVSVIPEGLPAVITITLAVGVYRMAKKKAVIRKLQSVETLGAITVIASDKTGTLTYNQMTVERIFFTDKEEITVTGKGYEPEGELIHRGKSIKPEGILKKLLEVGLLCNNSQLIFKKNSWHIQGDPTEGALVVAAAKGKIEKNKINEIYPRLDEIPFSSERKYMATLNKYSSSVNLLTVKGTVEEILNRSEYYLVAGKKIKLNELIKNKILQTAQTQAKEAYRLLALAYTECKKENEKINEKVDVKNLIYLGFVTMKDPLRKDAIDAISKCKQSGIRPIMITGDHPETALAIGKQLGIATDSSSVLSSLDLQKLSPKELINKASEISIFARITPDMKLKIVESLQANNQIVAVTGDGVNDAPVLKRADVGIAMGRSGTDVARESADMVLLDDNFSTILSAIEEGRTIFLNIRRVVFYLLSTSSGEILILVSSLLLGLPLPILPVQILWINLLTDTPNGIPLALEPKHVDVAHYPPRNPKEGIINKIVAWRVLWVAITMLIGTLFLYQAELVAGSSLDKARTVAFVTMIIFQIFNVVNTRSLKTSIFGLKAFANHYIIWSVVGSLIMTVLTVHLPLFRNLLHTVPLTLTDWVKIVLVCLSVFVVVEIDKGIRKALRSKY